MITIYDLLEIEENATKDEIDTAYSKLLYTYRQDPSFSEEKNKENEMIINKIKIAYEILSDETKRKRYDTDLSKKRAENLLSGLSSKEEKRKEESKNDAKREPVNQSEEDEEEDENPIKPAPQKKKTSKKKVSKQPKEYDFDDGDVHTYDDELNSNYEEDVELTKEEQAKLKKAAQEEFQKNLIKAKKAEEEYKKAYEEAYNQYMKKNTYASNGSMTLRKFITIFVSVVVIILVFFIVIHLPPVKRAMNTLYEENEVYRVIVDIIKGILGD